MIKIPNQSRQWNQDNRSDLFGNIFVTKNITFDNAGYLRLSYSPRAAMNETIDAQFGTPSVILFNEDYGYFTQTTNEPFQVDTAILSSYPQQISAANTPAGSEKADAVWFGGLMAVTENADVKFYNPSSNAWTDTNITLTNTAQSQHPLKNFLSLSALAIANVNTVLLYDNPITATPTLLRTLTILADFYITSSCYFNQNYYIGTMNRYGSHAYLYVWNGQGTAAQSAYEVDSNIIFDVCVHKDSVVLVTGNGSLLRFNGSGFTKLDAFPVFYTDQALTDETNIGMYHNMLKSNGDLLYINFNNNRNDKRLLSMPDGVWCYDENVGLYHRYSLTNSLMNVDNILQADVNTTTNEITVTTAPVTGTEVYFDEVDGLSPLINNTKYFVIKVNATTIKLAATKANATAGTAIDLISSGAQNNLIFFPNIDYGAYFTGSTRALNVIERPVSNTQYGTDLIWGARVKTRTNGTSNDSYLGTVSTGLESRGYFITPKIFSSNITDTFNRFNLKFSPFISELDKIIIKYRVYDDMRYFINTASNGWEITWTSTTTFTTTQTDWSEAEVGNEVEILQGGGGGLLAHITAISEVGGTYTVTLDDTYDNYQSGDKAVAVFKNWIKWKTIEYGDSNAEKYYLAEQLPKNAEGKFIQFKIELRGIQTRIEELLVDNVYRLPAKGK